ncbi:hemoglobin subunit alpha-like [Solea solea]|uniref:hemoglobin subunit alpha-like n=1 Tax=Solea solea TaxID=90069 RepID=UPI002729C086|nr:hemoglobin subunit alpha-like [Solea solea]
MSLSATDKSQVKKLWAKVEKQIDDIGAESLGRMLVAYPQTKTYFSAWKGDLNVQNENVRKHGARILNAVSKAVKEIDNLTTALSQLSELHASKLQVDPANFKLLAHNLILVLAMYFPADFTPAVHLSIDKFLAAVALALSENYR